jgi:phosphoribosyl-dephospho-CoA transferase
MAMFRRHNRVWLSAKGWDRAVAAVPEPYVEELARWAKNDWPAIIRRTGPGTASDTICFGVALPPNARDGRKIRIPLSACIDDIRRQDEPLGIDEIGSALPAAWASKFMRMSQAAADSQLVFRAFGSVALQAATGLPYVTAKSDIDLLFYPSTHAQLQEGLALVDEYAGLLPLDGEIVFPSGRAVAWKEWVQAVENRAAPRVLTKSMQSVNLLDCADLCAELEY